jgi:predicted NUDIX family NTP pyrophosphohydrolase
MRTQKRSAGLLLFRFQRGVLDVLLVHPGGPFWAGKDAGSWSIPKGEIEEGEGPLQTAEREFEEETGLRPKGAFLPLGSITQKSGKVVCAWAVQGDCDPAAIQSNTFSMEWPPRSGKRQEFPEIDRASFFTIEEAKLKIIPAQIPFLVELERLWESANKAPRVASEPGEGGHPHR